MRLVNSLVGQEGTRLIDFDVCGHGWFLYDFAASVSFIEKRSVYRDIQSRVGPGVSVGSGLKCRGRGRDRDVHHVQKNGTIGADWQSHLGP